MWKVKEGKDAYKYVRSTKNLLIETAEFNLNVCL